MGQILSSSDVEIGPCLIEICARLLSSCSMGLHSNWSEVPLLVVMCQLLSSCRL